jgi:hypothetical protein
MAMSYRSWNEGKSGEQEGFALVLVPGPKNEFLVACNFSQDEHSLVVYPS